MSAKRGKVPDGPRDSKRPVLKHAYCCPNSGCTCSFPTEKGRNMHLHKNPHCFKLAALHIKQHKQAGAKLLQLENDRELVDCQPWDDEEDEAVNQVDATIDKGTNVNDAINQPSCTYSESPHEAALRFGIRFTNEQFYDTKLLKLLSDANAPHFLYKDIVEWARKATDNGYKFDPERSSRNAQVKYLEKWLKLENSRPMQIPTTLPGPVEQVVQTTCFNFTSQLYSLVSDPVLFGDLANLDINIKDPFGKYAATDDLLSTTNSGQWYENAYKHEVKNPKDFLMPIIMACDETHLRKGSKASSWPLLFTTSILNQQMRNLPIAWRTLGYINDLSLIQSAAEDRNHTKELKAQRLHAIFKTILASLIKAQQAGALDNIPVTFGNVTKHVNLKVPVMFIIGDMQGGDKICCTSCHYSNTMNRLCRKCNVRGDQSGDPTFQCSRMSMVKMIKFVAESRQKILDDYNQYNVHNAWFDVSYGGCRFGIFSAACPIEPLHSLENGIIPDCLLILFKEEMTGKNLKSDLDNLVRRLTKLPRQRLANAGTLPDMPRLIWKDGITSLTDLSAKYKVGIMFTVIVVSLQDEGTALFTKALGTPRKLQEMRQVFQMILSYWVWLKRDTYWSRGNKAAKTAARNAISVMLGELIRLWPRMRGQGWEKAKIHEQLHVPDDIHRHGAPQGSHTGPTEHNHIRLVKRPAKGTQQRAEVFDRQLGQRVSDSYIIDMAYQRMTTSLDSKQPPGQSLAETKGLSNQGSKTWVSIATGNSVPAQLHFDSHSKGQDHFSPVMIAFLQSHYGAFPPVITGPTNPEDEHVVMPQVRLGTEYKRAGTIFRGHPNYRQDGPWYDWVMLRWARENNQNYTQPAECQAGYGDDASIAKDHLYAPGQILGFVESQEGDLLEAVVSTCDFKHSRGSVFSTQWQQSFVHHTGNRKTRRIEIVDVNSIVRHCLMIPTDDSQATYNEIWSRELWSNEFSDYPGS